MNRGLVWHRFLDPALVRHDLEGAAVRDPVGHRVHLALALAWCFLVSWPSTFVELAWVPVFVFSVIRAPNVWRTWGSFAVQPLFLAIMAFAAWQAVSLLWSPDPGHGVREAGTVRWALLMWALWPVMMHRRALIAAVGLGFLCGNLSQALQWAGVHFAWDWVPWHRGAGRFSGWWDPVVGGSMLCAALGISVGLAAFGRGRETWLGLLGIAGSGAGVLATGSRGAALAGVLLLAAGGLLSRTPWIRARTFEWKPPRHPLAGCAAGLLMAAALCLAVFWAIKGPLKDRFESAVSEVNAAVERHQYRTDTGARVLMAQWAWRAFREHPALGVGAGGYRAWTLPRVRAGGEADPEPLIHAHAHCAPLHIAATLGVVGVALAGVVVAVAIAGSAGPPPPLGERWGGWDGAPLFGLIGLLLAGLTDCIQINAQTAALLATLFAMSLVSRPPPVGGPYNGGLEPGAAPPPEQESPDGR